MISKPKTRKSDLIKNILVIPIIVLTVFLGQETTLAQNKPAKKLPPIKMLKKGKLGEAMHIYELPNKSEYQVFDDFGNFLKKGNAQFIDFTEYKKGIYFIKFGDKTEKYERK